MIIGLSRRDAVVILAATGVMALAFAMVREQVIPFHATVERQDYLLAGDEPEYLLGAWSLAHDGDLNLYNNVREKSWMVFQKRDVCSIGHGELAYFRRASPAMANASSEAWNGKQLLIHRPGTSVLISPAALSKEHFRWWAYFIVAAVASLGVGVVLVLAVRAGLPAIPASVLAVLLALSPPGLFYANQAYPEIPAAVLLALAACFLLDSSPRVVVGSALCVAIAPWFSDRAILPAAALGLACFWSARRSRALPILLGIFGVGAVLLAMYYWRRFHVPWPVHHNWRYHASAANIPALLPRVLLDRGRGLIWLCPALILLPAALYSWWRSAMQRSLCVVVALAVLAGLMGVASFPDWEGGVCPAGRYGVIYQWLALPAFFAWYRAGMSGKQKTLLLVALLAGAMISLLVVPHPSWWYRSYHPLFGYPFMDRFYDLLPSLGVADVPSVMKAAAWAAVFALCNVLAVLPAHRPALRTGGAER